MIAIGPPTSEELRSQKSSNQMAGKYYQLRIMTNYPTKYESYQTNDLTGVAFAIYNYIENA